MRRVEICTKKRTEFVDITSVVDDEVSGSGIREGVCILHCPHTTAGLTINEHADPSVATDMLNALDRLIPEDGPWMHREGNAPAHLKASWMGACVHVPICEGKIALGRWQGVFLCEFDGPRARELWLRFMA